MNLLSMLAEAEKSAGVPVEWILGAVAALGTAALTGVGSIWKYWTEREKEKTKTWQSVVNSKDEIIASKDKIIADLIKSNNESLNALRIEKDAAVDELSKKLSLKSDHHAEKIEELMRVTVAKVEEMGNRNVALLDRALKVQAEFTAEVRNIPRTD